MPQVRYTVLGVSRGADEPACHHHEARATWLLTLSDSAGKRHLLTLAQPLEQSIPAVAGTIMTLDARLVSVEEAPKG